MVFGCAPLNFVGAHAMGGNLEAVFEARDHPTAQDYFGYFKCC